MKSVGIVIPTTGNPIVFNAIKSALNQTYDNVKVYLVVDGAEYSNFFFNISEHEKMVIYYLSENTGKNGNNGHRIYSAFSFLINTDYICYLDQDCFYEPNHVKECVQTLEKNNLDWCYSLRNIVNVNGDFVCRDNCEALGEYNPVFDYNLVDTNCYFLKTAVAQWVSPSWIGSWGHDRRYFSALTNTFKRYAGTGKYTVNYRMGGRENRVREDFFLHWNEIVKNKFNDNYPWVK
jgi:glycosyltransferase involved in cell wall biosynthesis